MVVLCRYVKEKISTNFYVILTCFFRHNFDEQKNWHCYDIFFDAVLIQKWCKFEVLIFICFWKTKNCCPFDISFWKVFDISKTKTVWTSLLDVILPPCNFSNNFIPPWNALGDYYTGSKNIYTNRYLIGSCLFPFSGFLSNYYLKHCWKMFGEPQFSVRCKLMRTSVGVFSFYLK